MKKILFSFLLLGCLGASAQTDPLANEGIRGPVKSISQVEYKLEGNKQKAYTKAKMTFNRDGSLAQQIINDPDYQDSYAKYTYDYDDGQCIRRNVLYRKDKPNVCNEFEYDDQGRMKTIRTFDTETEDDEPFMFGTITYRADQIVEKQYRGPKKSGKPCETYYYNLEGDMTKDDDSGDVTTFTYPERDSHGNWTKRLTFEGATQDDSPTRVTTRKIAYW